MTKKIIITSVLVVSIFATYGFLNDVYAYDWGDSGSSCGSCGGDGSPSPEPGGDGSPSPEPQPQPQAPSCDFLSASQTTVPANGGNVTLSWGTTNVTGVTLWRSGDSANLGTSPSLSVDGSKTVSVTKTSTFRLDAWNAANQQTSCTVTVTVSAQPPTTNKKPARCDFFTANRITVPANGGNVTLSWGTTDATSVSINNGVGTVSADGTTSVFVNANTSYTLTATGTDGNDSCEVSITKETAQDAPRCDYLRVSNDNVKKGANVTLSWETTNATSASLNQGIGSVSTSGSRQVKINNDITYTLTVTNASGSRDCSVRIEIEEDEEESRERPRCELDISKSSVKRGERVTLSWETDNVDEIIIKDDRGKTIFDTNDYSSSQRKKYFDGEVDVIINQSTEFRMTAYGVDGGTKTCRVDVNVNDVAVYEKRDQGYVIALTQVPYTGFEAGTFLTFLFYAVLTLWALFIAYVLVVKKGSVLGFSLYGTAAGMTKTDMENRKKVEALVAKYSGQNQK